ncbi:MAG TPA: tannase/feruloyl esterase family alpha/beta hydrolase [Candidatus Acidoferrum sp.]|nr:tannase/feruloyl esterase family alpha/beta hydrolase [Candidatus Acidoferrum sp.]
MNKFAAAAFLLVGSIFIPAARAAGTPCEQLAQLTLPNTIITSAETVAAGAFTPPATMAPWLSGDPKLFKRLPAFCRLTAEAKPTTDSNIKIEVWMPVTGWNGKFRGQGNGGFAGEIDYGSLAGAVAQGYATAATDTGHAAGGTDASWALGHPEKIVDFAYRGIHEMTLTGKAVVKVFYGDAPQRAYFANCSNGGREALMEAQRFPDDYDGILAGAPANYFTHLLGGALYDAQTTTLDPASYIPTSKIPFIARSVNAQCDAMDGVTDGVLNDPRKCHVNTSTMICKTVNTDDCLTSRQADTLERLYAGAHDSKGNQLFPGFLPGGEDGDGGWPLWITGQAPGKSLLFAFGGGFFSDMVYDKADWDYKKANLDDAVATADKKFSNVLNATETNLKPFESHGGKLIIYHGWNDAAISPLNTINYYENVGSKMGQAERDSFVRLFMVPGMQHCGGGPGPDVFGESGWSPVNDPQHNIYLALEQWVEKGAAPSTVIASKVAGGGASEPSVKGTRPLCAYPQVAKYKGSGDTNDAANFTCAPPAN